MSGSFRQFWYEWRSLYLTGSVLVDWGWWGLVVGSSIDFKEWEVDLTLHVGPFKLDFSGGKD